MSSLQPSRYTSRSRRSPRRLRPRTTSGPRPASAATSTKESWKKHAHANGIHQPGKASPLQNQERLSLADAPMLAKFTADTTLYYYDYDSTRGDDKFKVQGGARRP